MKCVWARLRMRPGFHNGELRKDGIKEMKFVFDEEYAKKLRDEEFVVSRRNGRHIYYSITRGIHKTALQCIHKRYDGLADKCAF